MIKRVILLVVDGLGVGATEDASSYGDAATHTLAHLAESAGGLSLPTLESLGLGHVTTIRGVRSMAQPVGCFGRLAFKSKGVDSLVGFWEIAGCLTEDEGRAFPEGYSSEAKAALEDVFGLKIIGGHVASAEEALQELGASHLSAVPRLSGPTVVRPVMWPPMTKCGPPICCINGVGKHARR